MYVHTEEPMCVLISSVVVVYVHVLCLCLDMVFSPLNIMTHSPPEFLKGKSDDVWLMYQMLHIHNWYKLC
jgi:hypothetical protein